jgi:hypothetical protein
VCATAPTSVNRALHTTLSAKHLLTEARPTGLPHTNFRYMHTQYQTLEPSNTSLSLDRTAVHAQVKTFTAHGHLGLGLAAWREMHLNSSTAES